MQLHLIGTCQWLAQNDCDKCTADISLQSASGRTHSALISPAIFSLFGQKNYGFTGQYFIACKVLVAPPPASTSVVQSNLRQMSFGLTSRPVRFEMCAAFFFAGC